MHVRSSRSPALVLRRCRCTAARLRRRYRGAAHRPRRRRCTGGRRRRCFTDQRLRPALVAPVRRPGARRSSQAAALAANHDVRVAVARVEQARAVFDEAQRRSLSDRHGRRRRSTCASRPIPGFTDEPIRTDTLSRRLRRVLGDRPLRPRALGGRAPRAATADSLDAALDDVRVSVAAEVARNYFELRGLQQQLAVLERSLANQRETLRLTQVRRDAGIGEEQDVASAAARVAAIEAACRRCGRRSRPASIGWRC